MDDGFRRTAGAVAGAVAALGETSFVVGILPPRGLSPEAAVGLQTLHKTVSASTLTGEPMLRYLRLMNSRGHDIYIKPASVGDDGKLRPPLVLLDDLAPSAIEAMRRDGCEPCLVVSTSRPDNLQAWVRVGTDPLPRPVLFETARDLAARYGGDPFAAKSEQFGRLPGFTNRKPVRIAENGGRPPFARVLDAVSRIATASADILARAGVAVRKAADERIAARIAQAANAARRSQDERDESVSASVARHWHRASTRADGDLSRADFAAACGALRDGHTSAQVQDALASVTPGLPGRHTRPEDYLRRTVEAAEAAVARDGYEPPRPTS